ncbi:MAG: hypothetical protein AAGA76_07840 [Pseudomonadota bacterium]
MTEDTHTVPNVTRVEVISEKGREYVNLNCHNVKIAMQDGGKTMKIFIDLPIKGA